jgi:uncharacterized protein (TIGR02145 family)
MKQLLILCLITSAILTACSKKSKDTYPDPRPTVTTTVTLPDSVKIGTQWWTSVNYAGTGGINYNNATTTNSDWGKLYTNDEIGVMKVPKPWRVPTIADFNKLMEYVGARSKDAQGDYFMSSESVKLMAKTTWLHDIGTNTTGFNAFPGGFLGDGGGPDFHYASGSNNYYYAAAFATSSPYLGPRGGRANFFIIQNTSDKSLYTGAGITSYSPAGGAAKSRTSLRFVRDN